MVPQWLAEAERLEDLKASRLDRQRSRFPRTTELRDERTPRRVGTDDEDIGLVTGIRFSSTPDACYPRMVPRTSVPMYL